MKSHACYLLAVLQISLVATLLTASGCGSEPPSGPFKIVKVEEQPVQYLVQVVVPAGTTSEEINSWHPKIYGHYSGRGKPVFVNYYDREFDFNRLVASGTKADSAAWIGPEQ
ncbi:hypothetical protein AB1K70_20260 [Bremerella sp. JC770]|uniref:hypothetical protein n=1 Tax=Bremerella sp. JC770 TaxID=3232137 RepID=UPI00345ABCBA